MFQLFLFWTRTTVSLLLVFPPVACITIYTGLAFMLVTTAPELVFISDEADWMDWKQQVSVERMSIITQKVCKRIVCTHSNQAQEHITFEDFLQFKALLLEVLTLQHAHDVFTELIQMAVSASLPIYWLSSLCCLLVIIFLSEWFVQ